MYSGQWKRTQLSLFHTHKCTHAHTHTRIHAYTHTRIHAHTLTFSVSLTLTLTHAFDVTMSIHMQWDVREIFTGVLIKAIGRKLPHYKTTRPTWKIISKPLISPWTKSVVWRLHQRGADLKRCWKWNGHLETINCHSPRSKLQSLVSQFPWGPGPML